MLRKMFGVTLTFGMLFGGISAANAADITLNYIATITDITHNNGGFGDTSGYVIGGNAHGSITFNDDASDSHSSTNVIEFRTSNAPTPLDTSITVNAGASSFAWNSATNTSDQFFISNDFVNA